MTTMILHPLIASVLVCLSFSLLLPAPSRAIGLCITPRECICNTYDPTNCPVVYEKCVACTLNICDPIDYQLGGPCYVAPPPRPTRSRELMLDDELSPPALSPLLEHKEGKRLEVGGSEYDSHVGNCGAYGYDGYLHVDNKNHFRVVAAPTEDAIAAGCPYILAHTVYTDDAAVGGVQKEVRIWNNWRDGHALYEKGAIFIGTYQLSVAIRAFENTEPNHHSNNGAAYHIVTNNCATFVVNFASQLGVKIDASLTSRVARRLLEHASEQFMGRIRNSLRDLSISSWMGDNRQLLRSFSLESASDEELIEHLVASQASKLLDH